MNVHGQGLQGGDVHDLRSTLESRAGPVRAVQAVDAHEEGSQRLARARGGRYQGVPAGSDLTPPFRLRLGWPCRKTALEPLTNGWVKGLEHPETLPPGADNLPWALVHDAHLTAVYLRRQLHRSRR